MTEGRSIDPDLVERVMELSGESTRAAAIGLALREFIARRHQSRLLDLFDTLEWVSGYDYKRERER